MPDNQSPPLDPKATSLRHLIAGIVSTLDFCPAEQHPESCLPIADVILAALSSPEQGEMAPPIITRTRPFSCGSEFADWSASNCEQCIAQNGCPLEAALGLAYIGDGNIAAHAAALIGCDGIYPQPCTLRHHKKDGTKTRDEVLARIDAALNEEVHP